MAHAQECDSCGVLFKPVEGAVSIEYSTRTTDGYYQGYSPDDHDDRFSLCPKCSKSFLAFIKHDGNRGDGQRGSELPNSDDAKDAARWRWWCRWWLDEKDDMETINGLVYEGDSKPSLDAAIDAELLGVCKSEGPKT